MKQLLLSILALSIGCFTLYAQSTLPSISSATYSTDSPASGSTNSATTVKVKVPSISDVSELHLLVVTASNDTLVDQRFNAKRSLSQSLGGGYTYSLRFFSSADLSTATITVALIDDNEVSGSAFTVTAE